MNNFYTYAYLRKNKTPYYIGKGSKNRAYANHGKVPVPARDRILFLKTNISEREAIHHEIYTISVFGRKDLGTGILLNLTNGGEGTSGYVYSQKQKNNSRVKRIKAISISLQSRSEGKKQKWKKTISNFYLKLSEEEKEARGKMTTEEVRAMVENQQKVLMARSEEEKRKTNEKRSISVKKNLFKLKGTIIMADIGGATRTEEPRFQKNAPETGGNGDVNYLFNYSHDPSFSPSKTYF